MSHSHIKSSAFTLVELIVVITILAILSTIAFLSFQGYSSSTRDSVRLSDSVNISKALTLYSTTSGYCPLPESSTTVTAGGGYSIIQGVAGKGVLGILKMSEAKDALDGGYYSYSVNQARTKYSLGVFLENQDSLAFNDILMPIAYALDYSKRTLVTKGDVGILTETGAMGLIPVEQSDTSGTNLIDLTTTPKNLTLNLSKTNAVAGSSQMLGIIQSLQKGGYNFSAPKSCPTGFIAVPGNPDFNQPGFCIMKYEAKALGGVIGPVTGVVYKTHDYTGGDQVVSNALDVPIAVLSQPQAIAACQSIGAGYHLVTENEWMTLARNIETIPSNWSGNATGSGYVYNGHVNGNPGNALPAGTDDLDGLNGITGGTGTTTAFNNRRTLSLSNGNVIWDISGNVWEYVNKGNTMDGTNNSGGYLNSATPNVTYTDQVMQTAGWEGATQAFRNLHGPSKNIYGTGSGMGNYMGTNWNAAANIFVRGCNATCTASAGIFTLGLHMDNSGGTSPTTGFRCAK